MCLPLHRTLWVSVKTHWLGAGPHPSRLHFHTQPAFHQSQVLVHCAWALSLGCDWRAGVCLGTQLAWCHPQSRGGCRRQSCRQSGRVHSEAATCQGWGEWAGWTAKAGFLCHSPFSTSPKAAAASQRRAVDLLGLKPWLRTCPKCNLSTVLPCGQGEALQN